MIKWENKRIKKGNEEGVSIKSSFVKVKAFCFIVKSHKPQSSFSQQDFKWH